VPTVTSRQNPIVARYRAAARGDDPSLMLLDGVHLLADALAAGVVLHDVAIAAGAEARDDVHALRQTLERGGIPFVTASAAVMDALSPVRSASPVVALAARPPVVASRVYGALGPHGAGRGVTSALVVIAAAIQDPGNLGAIVRVAEASGAAGLVVAGASADPFGWKALRGSMGSALRLPIAIARDLTSAVTDARGHGCRIVATVPRGGQPLFAHRFAAASAILIGGEGPGLAREVVDAADDRVTIPMQSPVESLNAAVTAAVVLFEAHRQRVHDTDHHSAAAKP